MGIALAWPDARRFEFGRQAGAEPCKHGQAATFLARVRVSSSSAYVHERVLLAPQTATKTRNLQRINLSSVQPMLATHWPHRSRNLTQYS